MTLLGWRSGLLHRLTDQRGAILLESWKSKAAAPASQLFIAAVGKSSSAACAQTLAHYQLEHQVERRVEWGGNMSTATVPEVREGYFPHWKLKTTGVIMPEERLPWGQTIVSGLQHGVAMA